MVRTFVQNTPQAVIIVIGLACACLTLEAQRIPSLHEVSFDIHHPIPYVCEAAILFVFALIVYRWYPELQLKNNPALVITIGALTYISLSCVFQETSGSVIDVTAVSILYRTSSALLFVLWGEQLFVLGARSAAIAFVLATAAGGAVLAILSILTAWIAQAVVVSLPLVSMGALLSVRIDNKLANDCELDAPLFVLPNDTSKALLLAFMLIAIPMVTRAPLVSVQSFWMSAQDDTLNSLFLQLAIATGWLLGAALSCFIAAKLWNEYGLVFHELLIPLLGVVALYAAQTSGELWFIYLPIIDASYRVVLLFVVLAPFILVSARSFILMPLCFGLLILSRALFAQLWFLLSSKIYSSVAVLTIVFCMIGGTSVLFVVKCLRTSRKGSEEKSALPEVVRLKAACRRVSTEYNLTKRESEILLFLAQRYNASYIAQKLILERSTVKTHMRNLYAKLGVHSQAELLLLIERVREE